MNDLQTILMRRLRSEKLKNMIGRGYYYVVWIFVFIGLSSWFCFVLTRSFYGLVLGSFGVGLMLILSLGWLYDNRPRSEEKTLEELKKESMRLTHYHLGNPWNNPEIPDGDNFEKIV